jgi:assimilatory nitrate reductase catalytic subunit
VFQDIFPTETTRFTNVILHAGAWSENDGIFSSSKRRVDRVRTASVLPVQAKPNSWIFKELAKKMG